MDTLPPSLQRPLAELLLSVADDKLFLGHHNSDWTGVAPILEEDIAFSSLSQDELAHAAAIYEVVASLLGTTVDRLAYGRPANAYRCGQLVELADDFNWALALARSFYCDHFDYLRLSRLGQSSYTPVAELGRRLAAEEQIHVQHVDSWIKRLGRGGDDARERVQNALLQVAGPAALLFEPTEGLQELEREGIYPGDETSMFKTWIDALSSVAADAGIKLDISRRSPETTNGRSGHHLPTFQAMLDELTEVYRLEPEAKW